MRVLSVAKDFTRYPTARYHVDSPRSGEVFRTQHLVPLLEIGRVRVLLDGTAGYGSNFLQGAFGDLVLQFSVTYLEMYLQIVSDEDPSLVHECWEYIRTTEKPTSTGPYRCNARG